MNIGATLFGQAITFAIFVGFTMRFVWPALMEAMETREKRIADGLQAAQAGHDKLAQAEQEAAQMVRLAKDEATEIIARANQRALVMVEEAKQQAKQEGERLRAQAAAEIEQDVMAAKQALRREVASLAIQGAQKVLGRGVDASANDDLLEQLVSQI